MKSSRGPVFPAYCAGTKVFWGAVSMYLRLYEKVPCVLLQKKRRPHTVKIFLKNFKRPKNREDRSDFEDFLTELIAMTSAIISKNFLCAGGGEPPKISKSYRKIFTDHTRIGFIQTASNPRTEGLRNIQSLGIRFFRQA